jgi:hypothetical protein
MIIYLMKVIPETRREHEIGYLHFHICISRILHLKEAGQIGPKPNHAKLNSLNTIQQNI